MAAGYLGMKAGEVIAIPGLADRINVFVPRFAPRGLVRAVAARLDKA